VRLISPNRVAAAQLLLKADPTRIKARLPWDWGEAERRSRAGFLEKCWTAFAADLDPHDLEASGGMHVKCAVGFFVDILRKL